MSLRRVCAGCGSDNAAPHFRELVRCRSCGLVYFPRRLPVGEVQRLYSQDYFNGAEYYRYLDDIAVHAANFRSRVRDLRRWLPDGRRLFEIGCAYGLFLNEAKLHWPAAGCDIAAEPCRHAKDVLRLDVAHGDFLDLSWSAQTPDAVVMWDVIEHLEEPARYLARAAEMLPAGGILALTTGDIGSWLARRQGPNWRQIHPPTHLWYFDRPSLHCMLTRFGFEVLDIRAVGMWRSVGQILHGLNKPSARQWCERLGVARRGVWLNTFDLMRVIARKRGRAAVAA